MRIGCCAMLLVLMTPPVFAAAGTRSAIPAVPDIYSGTIAGDEIQLRFHSTPKSHSILGATWRPATRSTRLIEGTWLDKRRFTAVESSSASRQTGRIRAVLENSEIHGTWTVAGGQKAVPFTLRVVRTAGFIELLNDGRLAFEAFDRLSRALDDRRWEDAIYSTKLDCGLNESDCEWPNVVTALSRGSDPRSKPEQKELRALVEEVAGDRALAKQWYLDECSRGLRFSCDRLLVLTPASDRDARKKAVRAACEHQALACSEEWGGPEMALIEACERGDEAAVRSMLETKVNIEAGGHLVPTPLLAATTNGSLEIVKLLLDRGANPNSAGDGYGRLPLLIAVEKNRPDLALLLLDHGADPNTRGIYGSSPALEVAACRQESHVVHAMLERGADPDLASSLVRSALICAVDNDDEAMVRELLQHGASPEQSGKFSLGSALDHAKRAKNHRMIQLLSRQQP